MAAEVDDYALVKVFTEDPDEPDVNRVQSIGGVAQKRTEIFNVLSLDTPGGFENVNVGALLVPGGLVVMAAWSTPNVGFNEWQPVGLLAKPSTGFIVVSDPNHAVGTPRMEISFNGAHDRVRYYTLVLSQDGRGIKGKIE